MTLEEIGAPAQQDALVRYAQAARQLAEREVASVPRESRAEAATAVVIGTVLWEPVLLSLRRLAHEVVSAELLAEEVDGRASRTSTGR